MKVPTLSPSLFPNRELAEAWAAQVEIVRHIEIPAPLRTLAHGEIVAHLDEAVEVVMAKGADVFIKNSAGKVIKVRRQDVKDI